MWRRRNTNTNYADNVNDNYGAIYAMNEDTNYEVSYDLNLDAVFYSRSRIMFSSLYIWKDWHMNEKWEKTI